jgi:hypothetical protein
MTGRSSAAIITCSVLTTCLSQDIQFKRPQWGFPSDITKQRELRVVLSNEERFDTVYTDRLDGSGMDMETSHTPLSRYEYACDGRLLKRIQIRQESRSDTVYVDHVDGTGLEQIIRTWIEDIPEGDYIEYGPGWIKLTGHLNGFDEFDRPKKVGEWIEYDEAGNLVSRKSYP